ncbi:rhomboid family intramembrane serine protease [Desulfopila sp. IMCC35008]|uniref:rhomboid family intramembrane serine protease n=1 Tax=Desulfopila sp. IMCC35008 TaxID=2653858 RepID=UPI0013D2A97C|nr:rhomboid family intramembrane serine protease [Desulfopila sp. IMCC35008]
MKEDQSDMDTPLETVAEDNLHLYSLVLSACDINHKVRPGPAEGFTIQVAEKDLLRAEYELHLFKTENDNWPPSEAKVLSYSPLFRANAFLVTGLLVLLYTVTGPWSDHSAWFTAGSANSEAILAHGEYFRLITALTLHADVVHLLGNCFLGGILLHYFLLLTGNGLGMISVLFASTVANLINAAAHGPGHNSVGFSTAVFAVIGILSILNYRQYRFSRPLRVMMPLMAGSALLAMLGSSGERTDLGAHFFGLVAGFGTGTLLLVLHFTKLREKVTLQFMLGILAIGLPFYAWYLALS